MKYKAAFALVITIIFVNQAYSQNLIVAAGETRTITRNEEIMVVRNFTMGDGASIVLSPDIRKWEITAERARFGRNVSIIGSSGNGMDGENGAPSVPYGGDCTTANNASAGVDGDNGIHGRSIYITTGIETVGSLRVESNGGKGGRGGNGGQGGNGGNADCSKRCNGGGGGNGGDAGRPGHGGNGGSITFNYKWLSPTPPPSPDDLIVLVAEGGEGGRSGIGGAPGSGGSGTTCEFSRGRSSGPPGQRGREWPQGADGHIGNRHFERIDGVSLEAIFAQDSAVIKQ